AIGTQAADGPDRLWTLLERTPNRWVLVIDGADDPGLLAAPALITPAEKQSPARRVAEGTGWVRDTRRGLVLVTSRHRAQTTWGTQAGVQRVDTLSDDDAAQVLRDLAPQAGSHEQAE